MSVPTATSRPTIGVLGSGPVGQGIAELLSRADYSVSLGTRQPQSAKLDRLPPGVRRSTFQEAAQADRVFLAVLHSASRELVLSLENDLKGKLLVDTDYAWLPGHAQAAGLNSSLTEGTWMARLLPQTHVTPGLLPHRLGQTGTRRHTPARHLGGRLRSR